MTDLALAPLAFTAGVLSFTSPCCLPLLPGYLSYISSLPVADLGERQARRVTLRASLLFVAGFTTVFTLLGLTASALGALFLRNLPVLVPTVLTTAAATRTAAWGAVLLMCYSLGLSLPFVLLGQGFGRATRSMEWLRRHGRHVELAGGALLVGIGMLFVTGEWQRLFIPLQRRFARWGWPPI